MDDVTRALAERAVKCKGWRPGVGAGGTCEGRPCRVVYVMPSGKPVVIELNTPDDGWETELYECEVCDFLPDLSDPATLGCLLALVREAWKDTDATMVTHHPACGPPMWAVFTSRFVRTSDWVSTEAAALVAALEAAP